MEVVRLTNWASSPSVRLNVNPTKTNISFILELWLRSVLRDYYLCLMWCKTILIVLECLGCYGSGNVLERQWWVVHYWAGLLPVNTGITTIFPYWRWLVNFTRIPPFIMGKMWDLYKHVRQQREPNVCLYLTQWRQTRQSDTDLR